VRKKLKQNVSSEALLNFYQSARLHIPEGSGLIKHMVIVQTDGNYANRW
jgi:hypothetical protein